MNVSDQLVIRNYFRVHMNLPVELNTLVSDIHINVIRNSNLLKNTLFDIVIMTIFYIHNNVVIIYK